ncbi:ATP-binding cassette sub-family A member 13 [Ctenodactylus gundi]
MLHIRESWAFFLAFNWCLIMVAAKSGGSDLSPQQSRSLFLILTVLRFQEPPRHKDSCFLRPRDLPSRGVLPFVRGLLCNTGSTCRNFSFEESADYHFRVQAAAGHEKVDSLAFLEELQDLAEDIDATMDMAEHVRQLMPALPELARGKDCAVNPRGQEEADRITSGEGAVMGRSCCVCSLTCQFLMQPHVQLCQAQGGPTLEPLSEASRSLAILLSTSAELNGLATALDAAVRLLQLAKWNLAPAGHAVTVALSRIALSGGISTPVTLGGGQIPRAHRFSQDILKILAADCTLAEGPPDLLAGSLQDSWLSRNPIATLLRDLTVTEEVKGKDLTEGITEFDRKLRATVHLPDEAVGSSLQDGLSPSEMREGAVTQMMEPRGVSLQLSGEDVMLLTLCGCVSQQEHVHVIIRVPPPIPSEAGGLLTSLPDVVFRLHSLLARAQHVREHLPEFLHAFEITALLDVLDVSQASQNGQARSWAFGSFQSLMKMVCDDEVPFFSNSHPFLSLPGAKELLEEDKEKLHIPPDSTPFCLKLYQEILQFPNGALVWFFLKPILHGKILYTPNTPEINEVIQKANYTFHVVHKFKMLSETLLRMSRFFQGSGSGQPLGQLQDILRNKFIRKLIESQLHVNVDTLVDTLQTYGTMLDKVLNSTGAGGIRLLGGLLVNLSSCVVLDRFQAVESEGGLEAEAGKLAQQNQLLAAVIFNSSSIGKSLPQAPPRLPPHVTYTIRASVVYSMRTDQLQSPSWTLHPQSLPADGFKYNYVFVPLQDMIERAIIAVQTGQQDLEPTTQAQGAPYPCHTSDLFLSNVGFFFPLIMTLAWVVSVASMVRQLVQEREIHMAEYLWMLGVHPTLHFLAWFLENVAMLAVSSAALATILKTSGVFAHSNAAITFLFLLDFGVSAVTLSYLLSAFFSQANMAALCASLVYLVTFLPYVVLLVLRNQLSPVAQTLLCLLTTTAFGQGVHLMTLQEGQEAGVQWDNVGQAPEAGGLTFSCVCWMMLLDSSLYFFCGWYLSNLIPGTFGWRKPWHFPLLASYWRSVCSPVGRQKRSLQSTWFFLNKDSGGEGSVQRNRDGEPERGPPGVTLMSVTKELQGHKGAVRDLTLTFYRGQITALLGANGAGKTTVISMLTGLSPPTSGTILVHGRNLQAEPPSIRGEVGVCLQQDVLLGCLTVREHLQLFASIKVPQWTSQELQQHVCRTLKDVGLTRYQHTAAHALSGGVKRKLSIAIAFLGSSKTVVLDEPTSGVDPCSRRSLWDILLKYREGRTIIFTTHHLDEAEALGDRVAVLQRGRLLCCSTLSRLKEAHGQGLRLTLTRQPSVLETDGVQAVARLTSLLQVYIPQASLRGSHGAEVTYAIPRDADKARLTGLLQALEQDLQPLCLESYWLSDPTLEEREVCEKQKVQLGLVLYKLAGQLDTALGLSAHPSCLLSDVSGHPTLPSVAPSPPLSLVGPPHDTEALLACDQGLSPGPAAQVEVADPSSSDGEKNVEVICSKAACGAAAGTFPPCALPGPIRGRQLLLEHVAALLRKRLLRTLRGWKNSVSGLLLPVLFVALAVGLFMVGATNNLFFLPWSYHGDSVGTNGDDRGLTRVLLRDFASQDPVCTDFDPDGEQIDLVVTWVWKIRLRQVATPCCGVLGTGEMQHSCPRCSRVDFGISDCISRRILPAGTVTLLLTWNSRIPVAAWLGGWSFGVGVPGGTRNANASTSKTRTLAKVWYHQKSFHSLPAYLNRLNNLLLWRHLPPAQDWRQYGITLYSHPYGGALLKDSRILESIRQFGVALCIVLGFSILSAFLGSTVVRDRVTGAKRLQHLSGLGYRTYWVTHFLYDMVFYLVSVCLCIAVILASQLRAFTFRQNLAATSLLLAFFGYATLPWMYLMSGVFPSADAAFLSYVSLNFVCGLGTLLMTTMPQLLAIVSKAQHLQHIHAVLKGVFAAFPPFCLGQGLIELCYSQIKYDLTLGAGLDAYVSPFEMHLLGWVLMALALEGTVLLLLRLLLHGDLLRRPRKAWEVFQQEGPKFNPKTVFFGRAMVSDVEKHQRKRLRSCDDLLWSHMAVRDPEHWMLVPDMAVWAPGRLCPTWRCGALGTGHLGPSPAQRKVQAPEDADIRKEQARVSEGPASGDILVLRNLRKTYGSFFRKTAVVHGVSLGVPRAECFGLLGVNGAGKSTVFKMLSGDVSPSSGCAAVRTPRGDYVDLTSAGKANVLVGYCPQQDALDELLTGWEHLRYYCSLRGILKQHVPEVAADLVRRLHLEAHADKLVATYSGGTKRKLSTALALVGQPDILLLDEPSSGMDPCSKRYLWQTITKEVRRGCAVVLTSHSMEECEAVCTRLAIMVDGSFRCLGSPQHIKNRFGDGYTVKVWLHQEGNQPSTLSSCLKCHFPEIQFKGQRLNLLEYSVPKRWGCFADLFQVLENNKTVWNIEHYSVSPATLEQVFMNFATESQQAPRSALGPSQDGTPQYQVLA